MGQRKDKIEQEKTVAREENTQNVSETEIEKAAEPVEENGKSVDICEQDNKESEIDEKEAEIDEKEAEIDEKEAEVNELKEYIQRLAAEFDNYKKRTVKEKEKLYACSAADVIGAFLPVLDNVELALKASDGKEQGIREGVLLIQRQIQDILASLDVKPIETLGKTFNPDFHEAVMHVDDKSYGENEIIEEFRKGYIYKDEMVIRHSVVKVAN